MLHMLCGKALKDKVSNNIHEMTGIESIDEFLWEQRLQLLTCRENGQRKKTNKGTALQIE